MKPEDQYKVVGEEDACRHLDIEYVNENGESVLAGYSFLGWAAPANPHKPVLRGGPGSTGEQDSGEPRRTGR